MQNSENSKIKENALKNECRYTLVMVAAKRARQIVDGDVPKVESIANKPVTIALDEIIANKIVYIKPKVNGIK